MKFFSLSTAVHVSFVLVILFFLFFFSLRVFYFFSVSFVCLFDFWCIFLLPHLYIYIITTVNCVAPILNIYFEDVKMFLDSTIFDWKYINRRTSVFVNGFRFVIILDGNNDSISDDSGKRQRHSVSPSTCNHEYSWTLHACSCSN